MHIHNVYFWLSNNQDDESLWEFEEGLTGLTNDANVVSGYHGKPADTGNRDVVDDSYSYGLVLVFEDKAGHDRYQDGAAHHRFLDANMKKWERVAVFDIES